MVGDGSLEGSGSSLPVSRQRSSTSVLATSASRSSCTAPDIVTHEHLQGTNVLVGLEAKISRRHCFSCTTPLRWLRRYYTKLNVSYNENG